MSAECTHPECRRYVHCIARRGGWVAPLQGEQFTALSSAVGPGSVMTGTDSGGAGDGGGDGGSV